MIEAVFFIVRSVPILVRQAHKISFDPHVFLSVWGLEKWSDAIKPFLRISLFHAIHSCIQRIEKKYGILQVELPITCCISCDCMSFIFKINHTEYGVIKTTEMFYFVCFFFSFELFVWMSFNNKLLFSVWKMSD